MSDPKKFWYWRFQKLYSVKEVKLLNKKIKQNLISLNDRAADKVIKTAEVFFVNPLKIKELEKMFEAAYSANRDNFGFNLFDSINDKHRPLSYNIYDSKVKGEYGYHADASYNNPIADIKLTGILNLSMEPYEGGKFFLKPFGAQLEVAEISQPGNMIIFPSWFHHKVTPVTKGKRITISFWVRGPKFV